MNAGSFFDTNILLYMYNEADRGKQTRARALFQEQANNGLIALSTQVVQEFYVVGSCKLGLPRPLLRTAVGLFLSLPLVTIAPAHILSAIEMEERFQLSFWDALILSAASSCGAGVLYTEDLSDGRRYGTVEVRNPFAAA
jgi:predicted nucleic acid-binding protein